MKFKRLFPVALIAAIAAGPASAWFHHGTSAVPPPPVISNISSGTPSANSATITWTTTTASSTLVNYGLTTGYGSQCTNASLVTSHTCTLSALAASTTHHFDVASTDAYAQTTGSGDNTFATSAGPDATPWAVLELGGGGNHTGIDVSAAGVRLVRGDVFGGYIFGDDSKYHNIVTTANMPGCGAGSAGWTGICPATNTSANQVWRGFAGVMELVGAPSDATKAFMFAGGNLFYSSTISTATPDAITWCAANGTGWSQTAETANNVVGLSDPGQFAAMDPANPDYVIVGSISTAGIFESFNASACASATWTAISTASIPASNRVNGKGDPIPAYAIAFDSTSGTVTRSGHTVTAKIYAFTAGQYATGVTINNPGTGYGANVTGGTLTYSTACGVNLVLTVNTDAGGAISAVTGFNAGAQCSPLPASSFTGYTAGNGLSTPNPKTATFNVAGTSAGVYASTDGGATWARTTGGPTTMRHIHVSAASLGGGGGNVWVSDTSQNLWESRDGTTWTQIASANGNANDVAIDPNNGDRIVAVNAASAGKMVVSTNGSNASPTFTVQNVTTVLGGDSPWLATIGTDLIGGIEQIVAFDLSGNLIIGAGQGLWTTPFTNGNVTLTAQNQGVQGAVNSQIQVTASQVLAVGAQDIGGCQYAVGVASRPNCFPQSALALNNGLSYVGGISCPPGNTAFCVTKSSFDFNGGFDTSGVSTDGFASNWMPYNRGWSATVAGSTGIANSGVSNRVRVTVPSTTGLTSFVAGHDITSNSIVCVQSFAQSSAYSGLNNCFEINVIDSTHIDMIGSTFAASQQTVAAYTMWVPGIALDDPLTQADRTMTIGNVTSDGGLVKITVVGSASAVVPGNGSPVCIAGVTMSGASVVNGCWTVSSSNIATNFDLVGSTFVGGDTYTTGGAAVSWDRPGGSVAAAATTKWTTIGGNNDFPHCTADGGLTWSIIRMGDDSDLSDTGNLAVTGGDVAAGATTITYSGSTSGSSTRFTKLTSGRWFSMTGTAVAGTFTLSTSPVPLGDSIPNGSKLFDNATGYPFAAFLNVRIIAADQALPATNVYYIANQHAGLMKWTNCGAPVSIAHINGSWNFSNGNNDSLKAVPGEAGHLFYGTGPQGVLNSVHPAANQLQRMCNGTNSTDNSATFEAVAGTYEPQAFGFGAAAPGKSYPAEYFVGWYSSTPSRNDAEFGIWRSIDDPNHGNTTTCNATPAQTWCALSEVPNPAHKCAPADTMATPMPRGWNLSSTYSGANDISGDPFTYGPAYIAGVYGAFYGVFP